MVQKRKPAAKPYPDFLLFTHGTGECAKKIGGRLHDFVTGPGTALDQRDGGQAATGSRSATW